MFKFNCYLGKIVFLFFCFVLFFLWVFLALGGGRGGGELEMRDAGNGVEKIVIHSSWRLLWRHGPRNYVILQSRVRAYTQQPLIQEWAEHFNSRLQFISFFLFSKNRLFSTNLYRLVVLFALSKPLHFASALEVIFGQLLLFSFQMQWKAKTWQQCKKLTCGYPLLLSPIVMKWFSHRTPCDDGADSLNGFPSWSLWIITFVSAFHGHLSSALRTLNPHIARYAWVDNRFKTACATSPRSAFCGSSTRSWTHAMDFSCFDKLVRYLLEPSFWELEIFAKMEIRQHICHIRCCWPKEKKWYYR